MTWFSRLTLNQRLALVAFLLGAVAMAAQPMRGHTARVDSRDLALIAQRDADHVTVAELADWMMTGRADYRLIDLRADTAYAEYRLPGAENIPLAALPEAELARNEKLVLYADDSVRAAQGWFLLKATGFKAVYMVKGGLEGWKTEILFPVVGKDDSPAGIIADAKRTAISRHFGGSPTTYAAAAPNAGAAVTPAVAMPKVAPPPPASPARKAAAAPKKKEGC